MQLGTAETRATEVLLLLQELASVGPLRVRMWVKFSHGQKVGCVLVSYEPSQGEGADVTQVAVHSKRGEQGHMRY